MTLTKKVFLNTSAQIGARAIGAVIGIVTFGFLTRYLGVAGYGDYTTIWAYNSFLLVLADFGFSAIMLRELSNAQDHTRRQVFRVSNFTRFKLSLLVAIVMLGLLPFLGYSIAVKLSLTIIAISILVQVQTAAIYNYLQAQFEAYKAVVAEVIARTVFLGGVIWILLQGLGLVEIFVLAAATLMLQFGINWLWIAKKGDYGFAINQPLAREIVRSSFWMGLVMVLSLTYVKIDTILLSLLKTSTAVGIYGAPYKVVDVMLSIPTMIMANIFPALSRAIKDNLSQRIKQLVSKTATAVVAIALPLVVGGVILAESIIELAAGADFVTASEVSINGFAIAAPHILQILMIVILLAFGVIMFNSILIAQGRERSLVAPYALAALFNIIANLIFIPQFSYLAAAITTLLSEIIILSFSYYLLTQSTPLVVNWCDLGKITAAAVLMGALILLLKPISLIATILLASLFYLLILTKLFKVFSWRKLLGR